MYAIYMVTYGSHQYTPFILAYIYQHHGSYGSTLLQVRDLKALLKAELPAPWKKLRAWDGDFDPGVGLRGNKGNN